MLARLYNWILSFAQTSWATGALAVVAFVESSFFPIPPDVLLIPLILAAPKRAFTLAAVCTVFSVLGGAFGYFIGAELFEVIGRPVLDFYHMTDAFETFRERFNSNGHWAVLFAGVTPFPYKVIAITSGVTELPFWSFMFWSLIARGLRFFIVSMLLWHFGASIKNFVEKRLGLVFIVFTVLLVAGFWLVIYL